MVLLRDAEPILAKRFMGALVKYIPTEVTKPKVDTSVFDEWGTGPKVYPPSSAERIIKFCPTLRYVAEERGNVEEPLWRDAGAGGTYSRGRGTGSRLEPRAPRVRRRGHPDQDRRLTSGPTTRENSAGLCERCEGQVARRPQEPDPSRLLGGELPPVAKGREPE